MIMAELPRRGTDDWGSGEFEASRGTKNGKPKLHKGIDWACYPETVIRSPVSGIVSNAHGIAYSDDHSYTYLEITDNKSARHRIFYIDIYVHIGDFIHYGDIIGKAQNIAKRYSSPMRVMKNHIHYEIVLKNKAIDPEEYNN